MTEELQRVESLLVDLFETDELRIWLRHNYSELIDQIGDKDGLRKIAHDTAFRLHKRGLLDRHFFAKLLTERPNRASDIEVAQSLYASYDKGNTNDTLTWLQLTGPSFAEGEILNAIIPDLEAQLSQIGRGIDIILLAGNLISSKQNYNQINDFISTVSNYLSKHGSSPVWLTVPGDLDIIKPTGLEALKFDFFAQYKNSNSRAHKALRSALWANKDPNIILPFFDRYLSWHKKVIRPNLDYVSWFPGDSSHTIHKNGYSVEFVGLNSVWTNIKRRPTRRHGSRYRTISSRSISRSDHL